MDGLPKVTSETHSTHGEMADAGTIFRFLRLHIKALYQEVSDESHSMERWLGHNLKAS